MKLRTQILLFFFAFGMIPLILAVVINLPLVIERTEQFYHKAHLLNLRADFRDLDQHLAAREELLKVLAKAPEPSIVFDSSLIPAESLAMMRVQYNEWINQIFSDQLDIVQISFYDNKANLSYLLERDADTFVWRVIHNQASKPPLEFVLQGISLDKNRVIISSLNIQKDLGLHDPRKLLNIRLMASLKDNDQVASHGAVMFDVDISGIAQRYESTLWVYGNGQYLNTQKQALKKSAFNQFKGLRDVFQQGDLALWKGQGEQIIWVPLFQADDQQTLWAGRYVDSSPMSEFRDELIIRVLGIICLLIIFLAIVATWIAKRLDVFNKTLMQGVKGILQEGNEVSFSWKGSKELEQLAHDLSNLAHQHRKTTHRLRTHAKELEEAYQYKSEFLANMSHELRTPLNSIILLSKLLKQALLKDPEKQQQASVINEAGTELKKLIDNVLDLSKIEAGQLVLDKEWVDLAQMLDDLVALMEPQFTQKGVALSAFIEPDVVTTFYSDELKLRQIMTNFLSNAVKFTQSGEVSIRLSTGGSDCPLRLSVKDTGIGISAEKHQHIFDVFSQADGSTTRKYGGTGLGLNISQRLAHLLGGHIQLRSEIDQGSTFTLCLAQRVKKSVAVRQPAMLPEPDIVSLSEDRLSGEVLIISEEIKDLLKYSQQLESWGLHVHGAGDVEEAIETLEDSPIQLILMSSDQWNVEASQQIKSCQQACADAIPVIIVVQKMVQQDFCESITPLVQPEAQHIKNAIMPYLKAGK